MFPALTRRTYLLLVLAIAAAVRLTFFTGFALGDDTFYALQSMALSRAEGWPPQPYHWFMRLGLIAPTSLSLRVLGPTPAAFVVASFLASLAAVVVTFQVATLAGGEDVARTAAWLHAFFPLEIIYATHLFPDVLAGMLCAAGIYVWIRALDADSAPLAAASGACFAAGYLVRETVFVCGPVLVACALLRRKKIDWLRLGSTFLLPVVAVIGAEMAVYAAATGDAAYRWRAMTAQQNNPANIVLPSYIGGGFWSDPALMLLFSQDIGPFFLISAVGAYAVRRTAAARVLIAWLVVGFVWSYYGTTVPWRWLPLHRDPRYIAFLVPPAAALAAAAIHLLPRRTGAASVALLSVCGLACAALDQGASIRSPHAALIRSPYAASLSLEPFEFYAAWWEQGLDVAPPFSCGADAGRSSIVALVEQVLPGKTVPVASTEYVAVSPTRRPDLVAALAKSGWTPRASFPGSPTAGRRLVAHLLAFVPTQEARARRLLSPPGLVVLRRPHM